MLPLPPTPPRWLDRLVECYCAPHLREEVLGDLHERFHRRVQQVGEAKARRRYWREVMAYLRPSIIKRQSTNTHKPIPIDMLKNYFTLALRVFARNKLVSAINVLGLALALSGSLLIALFVQDELSYDRYHTHADDIYRVTRNFLSSDGSVALHLANIAPPYGPLLANDFPDIKEVVRTTYCGLPLRRMEDDGSVGESLNIDQPYYAEPSIFTVFSIPILAGDTETALEKPATLMISDAAADRYFGTQDVVGERLKVDDEYLEITGVYEAFPPQSHWHPNILVSFSTLDHPEVYGRERLETDWGANNFNTYILVNEEFDPAHTEAQFPDFLDRNMKGFNEAAPSTWTNLFLQPLTSIHLHSQLDSELEANGNINHVYIMSAIGVFLLLIACFNFINLSTARATSRGKEVGLRKVVGAFRYQLVVQHLSESILVTLLAFLMATVLVTLALPWLNDFTGKSLQLSDYIQPAVALGTLVVVVLIGTLAGLYPAFVISGFKPALTLKGRSGSTRSSGQVRKTLVVVQFTVSIVMMIATLVTYQQLNFLNDRDLGYTKDQVVLLYNSYQLRDQYEAFYHQLTQDPTIINASQSSNVPTERLTSFSGTSVPQGDSLAATDVVMKEVRIDPEYFDTYEIPIVSGRNFSETIASDDSTSFIINETAARMVGWSTEEAVGQMIRNGPTTGTVVGVVQDFHFESLHQSIVPIIFNGQTDRFHELSVRVAATDMPEALAHMEAIWKQFAPGQPFNYDFLSDEYQHLYDSERSQNELFIIFATLAIFIAAMGLFGLATFSTQQRTKEVSIRKVLGAPVGSILRLLSKEVIVLTLIANAVAWPIAWYFMREWLSKFAYRIEMSVTTYLLAGALALLITLVTIGSQAIKAALTNPASILRND